MPAGLLEEAEAEQLHELVHHNISSLVRRASHYAVPPPASILRSNDAFRHFPHEIFLDQVSLIDL